MTGGIIVAFVVGFIVGAVIIFLVIRNNKEKALDLMSKKTIKEFKIAADSIIAEEADDTKEAVRKALEKLKSRT